MGAVGAIAMQVPAHAADFSADYTCTLPLQGDQNVTITGSLTASPNPATVNTPTSFQLHFSSSLSAPVDINSWSATADIDASGAETATFQLTGSGGAVPANQSISGDLAGEWTPTTAGTDQFQGGNVTINANVALLGNVTVPCTPNEPRPVAETLTVN
ncbi:MAG TPA: hypothetical protein VFU43_20595 [Streptosporangiaceae bacterium]|nr:hypothetical protein [Streptosporangiaceae bacterium]